jgi:hypothetical protein
VITWLVDIVDDCQGLGEFCFNCLSDILAGIGMVPQNASSSEHSIALVSDVVVVVEKLVLVDRHPILPEHGRLVALPRISTCIAHHNSLEVDLRFGLRQPVLIQDHSSQVRDVDPSIAFTGNEELIVFEVGEFPVEVHEGVVVV